VSSRRTPKCHPNTARSARTTGRYVGWAGQRWTTAIDLADDHTTDLREEEPDLIGVGMTPAFAIGQRALLVCTEHGNVLWDCTALIDDAARQRILDLGGIETIAMSHPPRQRSRP
jgi:hypothetical protein